jgi:predicted Zn-dependent peptidase
LNSVKEIDQMGETMEKITLENGLRVLLEPDDGLRSASFGVWVKSGSLYENGRENGISHFMEHMLFKGTERRSARRMAEDMDRIGGQMNAYTAKDYTCYYARTLQEHVPDGFDILGDMITGSLFDAREIETEKGVVLEELAMSEDLPEDKVAENLYAAVWRGPLAQPILGTRGTIPAFGREGLLRWLRRHYAPQDMVVAVCGRYGRVEFLNGVERYFAPLPRGQENPPPAPTAYRRAAALAQEEQEQVHVVLAFPGLTSADPRRPALNLLNCILGGSTSSRLFQRIREDLGLAYTVESNAVCYGGAGLLEVQTAVQPAAAEKACEEILREIRRLRRDGVTEEELARARAQTKAALLMGMESSAARVGHLGRSELLRGTVKSEEALVRELEETGRAAVNEAARELLNENNLSVSAVGPLREECFYRDLAGDTGDRE